MVFVFILSALLISQSHLPPGQGSGQGHILACQALGLRPVTEPLLTNEGEIICLQHLAQCLAQSKHIIDNNGEEESELPVPETRLRVFFVSSFI